jgi:hypothetical protein
MRFILATSVSGRFCDGADDDTSRMIRAQFRDVPGFDLDNPDDADLLKGLLDSCWLDILSTIELKRGARQNDEEDTEKAIKRAAKARTEARAFQKNLRREGNPAADAWRQTAIEFRKKYPDLYKGKTDEQLRRIWSR